MGLALGTTLCATQPGQVACSHFAFLWSPDCSPAPYNTAAHAPSWPSFIKTLGMCWFSKLISEFYRREGVCVCVQFLLYFPTLTPLFFLLKEFWELLEARVGCSPLWRVLQDHATYFSATSRIPTASLSSCFDTEVPLVVLPAFWGLGDRHELVPMRGAPQEREVRLTVRSLSTFFRDGGKPKQQTRLEFSLRRLTQVRCSFHSPMLGVDQHSKSCSAQLIGPSISWSLSLGPPQQT